MAEIVVQRRRHRSVWPWLLGLLALALLPLPFLGVDRDRRPDPGAATARRESTAQRDTTAVRDTTEVLPGGAGGAAQAGPRGAGGTSGGSSGQISSGTTAIAAEGVVSGASAATPARAGEAASTPPRTTSAPAAAASADRRTFAGVLASRPSNPSDREHREFTAEALRRLADELRALGASPAGVRAIRVHADSLAMPRARATARPDYARAAFLAAVREFDLLRAQYRVTVDTARLRSAAWAIRTDRPWLAQRSAVDSFLQTAHDALQALSRASTRAKD